MSVDDGRVEILLVEDNPTDAELCLRSLKRNNIANNIVWVRDGAEALDYLFSRGAYSGRDPDDVPRVVLLDLRLPKVEGREVLRQIKRDPRLRSIPVVVLTSSREDQDVGLCYEAGANSFVAKPVEFNAFAETVARLGYYWTLLNTPLRSHLKIIPPTLVREVMSGNVEWTGSTTKLVDAAAIMRTQNIGCLPVIDGERIIGILTEKDFATRATAAGLDPNTTTVDSIMTRQVIHCRDSDTIEEALQLMRQHRIHHLPVHGQSDKMVGIVSLTDLAMKAPEDLQGSIANLAFRNGPTNRTGVQSGVHVVDVRQQ